MFFAHGGCSLPASHKSTCKDVLAGLIAGLGVNGTAKAFVEGFRSMAFAGMLIGFARAIYVVAEQGQIIDTIVSGLFAPLSHLLSRPALRANQGLAPIYRQI